MENPQTLLIVFGPPVAGKRTLARKLETELGYRIYFDDIGEDFVRQYFTPQAAEFMPMVSRLRRLVFEEVAASYTRGFVICTVWDLNAEADLNYIQHIIDLFEEKLWKVKFVELTASLGTRMRRNENKAENSPDEILHESELLEFEDYKLNTDQDFPLQYPHLKINTTNLQLDETYQIIQENYKLLSSTV